MAHSRVSLAAWNNANLCNLVCTAHGVPTTFTDDLWICRGHPPRFYSSATTLRAGAQSLIATESPRFGFKDGFNDIDGEVLGYKKLFQAHWIWLEEPSGKKTSLLWRRIETDADLQLWENQWSSGDLQAAKHPRQFPPSLLSDSTISFMAGTHDGKIAAGCILNLSDPVVGISNQFGNAWHDYPQIITATYPGKAAVGYEQGDPLQQAQAAGFEIIAPLNVWGPQPPSS